LVIKLTGVSNVKDTLHVKFIFKNEEVQNEGKFPSLLNMPLGAREDFL
jgi:hypothetical protein